MLIRCRRKICNEKRQWPPNRLISLAIWLLLLINRGDGHFLLHNISHVTGDFGFTYFDNIPDQRNQPSHLEKKIEQLISWGLSALSLSLSLFLLLSNNLPLSLSMLSPHCDSSATLQSSPENPFSHSHDHCSSSNVSSG